ncbi:hypothetical protein B0H11DRAFT_2207847 [Mycena galericulata]|nr:hypothetical protein B0H11DRAFT_2207847 [Mycena galericulata]
MIVFLNMEDETLFLGESLRYRIGGITPDRAAAAAAAQLMHVSPSITHVLLLPPPPGDTTERRWARRWRVAVARAARERQRGAWCASREQGGGERRGDGGREQGRQAGVEGDGSRQCARWAPRGIKARRAWAAGGARDKPGLSSGVELTRCASDLRIASRARTHLRVPPASTPAGDAGAADREAWAVREHDPFSLPALTLPEARRTNRYDLIITGSPPEAPEAYDMRHNNLFFKYIDTPYVLMYTALGVNAAGGESGGGGGQKAAAVAGKKRRRRRRDRACALRGGIDTCLGGIGSGCERRGGAIAAVRRPKEQRQRRAQGRSNGALRGVLTCGWATTLAVGAEAAGGEIGGGGRAGPPAVVARTMDGFSRSAGADRRSGALCIIRQRLGVDSWRWRGDIAAGAAAWQRSNRTGAFQPRKEAHGAIIHSAAATALSAPSGGGEWGCTVGVSSRGGVFGLTSGGRRDIALGWVAVAAVQGSARGCIEDFRESVSSKLNPPPGPSQEILGYVIQQTEISFSISVPNIGVVHWGGEEGGDRGKKEEARGK